MWQRQRFHSKTTKCFLLLQNRQKRAGKREETEKEVNNANYMNIGLSGSTSAKDLPLEERRNHKEAEDSQHCTLRVKS